MKITRMYWQALKDQARLQHKLMSWDGSSSLPLHMVHAMWEQQDALVGLYKQHMLEKYNEAR